MSFSIATLSAKQMPSQTCQIPSRNMTTMARSRALMATRKPVRHPVRTMPCRAVFAPEADDNTQGNKRELSYEEYEEALKEVKLKGMELRRAHQLEQAKLAGFEATTYKAKRIIAKGAHRCKEATSSARLLQTKLERLKQETPEVVDLYATIDDKLEDLQRADQAAAKYKKDFLSTKELEEEEAYQRRKARATIAEAYKRKQELKRQRQQEGERFKQAINMANAIIGFLLQLGLKALPLRYFMTSANEAQQDHEAQQAQQDDQQGNQAQQVQQDHEAQQDDQQDKHSPKSKAAIDRNKPRFL